MEEWKVYNKTPNITREVSSYGRFRKNSIIWEPTARSQGYPAVRVNGKIKLVHRLVAEYFIPNPENKPFVLHWDDNPLNNHVDNLRWGTIQENNADKKRNGKGKGCLDQTGHKNPRFIKDYALYKNTAYSRIEIASLLNVTYSKVSNWKSGRTKCPYDITFL